MVSIILGISIHNVNLGSFSGCGGLNEFWSSNSMALQSQLWVSPQRNRMLATNTRHRAKRDPHLVHNLSLSGAEQKTAQAAHITHWQTFRSRRCPWRYGQRTWTWTRKPAAGNYNTVTEQLDHVDIKWIWKSFYPNWINPLMFSPWLKNEQVVFRSHSPKYSANFSEMVFNTHFGSITPTPTTLFSALIQEIGIT